MNDGNFGDVLSGTLTTTNNTATAVAQYGTAANSTTYFTCTFVGRRTDGVNAGDGAVLTLTCAFKNIAGTVTQIGTDTAAAPYASTSINASAASSAISGSTVSLRVAGTTATTINWVLQSSFAIASL